MSAIFWQTLKQRKWFIVWWCLGVGAMIAVNVAFYPSFKGDAGAQLDQSLAGLSDVAKAFISDTSSYSSPAGFLSSQVFYIVMPIFSSILAISLGSSLLSKEERDGTLELLLARPISRSRILAAKALAGIAICLKVMIFAALVTILMVKMVDMDVSAKHIASTFLVVWLLGLSFGAMSFAITTLGQTARLGSVGVAALLVGVSYILGSLSQVAEWLRLPAKFLPFYYYRPMELLTGTYAWRNTLYMLGALALLGAVSLLAFKRRDIGN